MGASSADHLGHIFALFKIKSKGWCIDVALVDAMQQSSFSEAREVSSFL